MSSIISDAPTINEIIYNRLRKRSESAYTVRPNKYHRGEYVKILLWCNHKERKNYQ